MKAFFCKQEIGIKRGLGIQGAPQGPAWFPSSVFLVSSQSPGDQVWAKKGNTVLDGEVNHKVGFKERGKKEGSIPDRGRRGHRRGVAGLGGGQGPGG